MLDESLTVEQQVLVLCEAVRHRDMKMISASAGLFDRSEQIVSNIHDTLQLVRKTDSKFGRTCDDKRSLVHSIILSWLPSPTARQRISLERLGMPFSSLRLIAKQLQTKRAALEGVNTSNDSVVFSQVVKRKGWGQK